jgi:type I restriction enzyme S subunit
MSSVAGVGGSLVRARPATVKRFKFKVPPLKLQKNIGQKLERLEAIRELLQKSLINLSDLDKSFQDLLYRENE